MEAHPPRWLAADRGHQQAIEAQPGVLLSPEDLAIHATQTRAANRPIASTHAHDGVERRGIDRRITDLI